MDDLKDLLAEVFGLRNLITRGKSMLVTLVTSPESHSTFFIVKIAAEAAKMGVFPYYFDVRGSILPDHLLKYKGRLQNPITIIRFNGKKSFEKSVELMCFYKLSAKILIILDSLILLKSSFLAMGSRIEIPYLLALLRKIVSLKGRSVILIIEARTTDLNRNKLLQYIFKKVDKFVELKRVGKRVFLKISNGARRSLLALCS
mgnify:CR=1 FL=1